MKSKTKILLLILLAIIVAANIIGVLYNIDPHKEIALTDIKSVTLYYRYSLEEKSIDRSKLDILVNKFNKCENYDKVYSEEIPCYSLTLSLKKGVKLVFLDIHSDDSILVERVFFGKTTKYELYDEELVSSVKAIIEEQYELHENEVCKKY